MTPYDQVKTTVAGLPVTMASETGMFYLSTEHPNHWQFLLNVYNNSGTVVVGDKNAVTTPAATSSTTWIYSMSNDRVEVGDLIFGGLANPGLNSVRKSLSNDLLHHSSERTSASGVQMTKITSFYPIVKSEHFHGRGKRKVCHAEEAVKDRRKGRKCVKRQRKARPFTTSSDVDVGGSMSIEPPLDTNSSCFQQGLQSFHCLCSNLHPLRDNGCWSEFDVLALQLLDQTGSNPTDRIIMDLEKSVALSYQKKLEESEDLINDAEKKISQTGGAIRLLLEFLANVYRAGPYRRRKRFGQKRQQCLDIAKKLAFGFPPCLPVGILLYEEGSYKRDVASILSGSSKEQVIAEAKKLMHRCIDLCCRLDQQQVYVRKQHVAVSKMALMNLHCETSVSRSRKIKSRNVVEAGELLDTLENEYFRPTEVQGTKIQRLIAKVDLFYRIDKFPEAEKVAQEALDIAKRLEFNLDVMPLEERLTDIRRKIRESSNSETFREIPRIIESCSCSSINNTPYSSESEDKAQV